MQISTEAWKAYVDRLSKLNKTAGDLMLQWVQTHGFDDTEALIEYAYSLVTKYGEGSAALSAEMYDAIAEMQNASVPPAVPAATASYGEVASAIQGTMKRSSNPSMVASTTERLVKQAGADTVVQNAKRDGAYFAWIPSGDTCAFCQMLASNGWVKASNKTVKGDHAQHIHANCDCTFAVRFNNDLNVKGYDPQKYRQVYDNAEGDTWQEKLNSMRRINYKEHREEINAQKRAAYAIREEQKTIEKLSKTGLKVSSSIPENGIINIDLDELVPCLRDLKTGELVDTSVGVVSDRSILKGFNKQTGWYINWQHVPKDCTVMALKVKGSDEIQGLVAFKAVPEHMAVRGHWVVANPKSNKQLTDNPEYSGIGGHLFAIMARASKEMGYDGFIEGRAANRKLLEYYINALGAKPLRDLDFYIDEAAAEEIIQKYNWEK